MMTNEHWYIQPHQLFVIFQNVGNFANFKDLHDFSTNSAFPTHSQQLLFSQPSDPSPYKTGGGLSNLYQT